MALKLTKQVKGINCEYWIIKNISVRKSIDKTIVSLALYYNQDARNLDISNDLFTISFQYDGMDYTIAQLYDLVKQEPDFAGAVDC